MARGQGGAAGSFRGPAGPRGAPRPPSGRCGPRLREGRPTRRGGPAEGRGAGRPRKFVPSGALRPAPTAPARPGPGAASAGGASSRAVRSQPSRGSWERAPGRRGCAALLCAGRPRPGSRRGWSGPARGGERGVPRGRPRQGYPASTVLGSWAFTPRPGRAPCRLGGPTASGSRARCTAVHRGRAVVRPGRCGRPPTGRGVVPPLAVRSSPDPPATDGAARRAPGGAGLALAPTSPSLPPGPRGSQPELQGRLRGRESGGRCIIRLSCVLV